MHFEPFSFLNPSPKHKSIKPIPERIYPRTHPREGRRRYRSVHCPLAVASSPFLGQQHHTQPSIILRLYYLFIIQWDSLAMDCTDCTDGSAGSPYTDLSDGSGDTYLSSSDEMSTSDDSEHSDPVSANIHASDAAGTNRNTLCLRCGRNVRLISPAATGT